MQGRASANPSPDRRSLWTKLLRALVLAGLATWLLEVRRVRERDPEAIARITAFNRRWANPLMLCLAGASPWGIARLEHRGRRSGALRATPLWAEPVSEGFLIALPYGNDVAWAKNLLHGGEGVIQRQGVRYRIGNPRIVPAIAARPDLPLPLRGLADAFGVRDYMRVDVLPSLTAEVPPPA